MGIKKNIFLMCIAISALHSKDLTICVKSINIETVGLQSVVKIHLSNGTSWKAIVKEEQEQLLCAMKKELQVGSEVMIMTRKYVSQYRIGNPDSNKSFRVALIAESKSRLLELISMEKVCLGEGVETENYEYHLTFSDGSVLRKPCLNNACYWKCGDAILASYEYDNGAMLLINVDVACKVDFSGGEFRDYRRSYWTKLKNKFIGLKAIDNASFFKEIELKNKERF